MTMVAAQQKEWWRLRSKRTPPHCPHIFDAESETFLRSVAQQCFGAHGASPTTIFLDDLIPVPAATGLTPPPSSAFESRLEVLEEKFSTLLTEFRTLTETIGDRDNFVTVDYLKVIIQNVLEVTGKHSSQAIEITKNTSLLFTPLKNDFDELRRSVEERLGQIQANILEKLGEPPGRPDAHLHVRGAGRG